VTWAVYPLLTAAAFYLGSQAVITRAIWSRYPKWLDSFMSCAACSGFWYGVLVALLGWWKEWTFLGLPGRDPVTVIVVGLCSIVWTPLLAYHHLVAMTAISQGDGEAPPPPHGE
jgi:hypothetical protein